MSRIIVADDSKLALTFYSQILDYLGHEVVLCGTGKEAVEEFKKKSANLLILDLEMPEMNGDEACAEIRKLPEGISTPIIIVSGHDDEKDIMQGLNAGANDYLVKPVKEAHLIAKLKTFLYTSALHKKDIDLVKNRTLFAGRYRTEKLIGYGSHSVVFMATDIQDNNNKVALKLLNDKFVNDNISKPFIQLAEKVKNISSENVLKIFEYGMYSGQLYMVLEYADGGDLANLLKMRNLSEHETAKLGADIARALEEFAQKDIVHLDLKPENIMISGSTFKLGDFGLTVSRESATMPINTEIWSTVSYMSPESLSDEGSVTIKSDIYSLGITLYQAVSGYNPFQADKAAVSMFRQINYTPMPLKDYDKNISTALSDIIELMLNKASDERPSLKELEYTLPQLTDFLEHKARIAITPEPAARPDASPVNDMAATENLSEIARTEIRISKEIASIRRRILKVRKKKMAPATENFIRILFLISLIFIFGSIGYLSYQLLSGGAWAVPLVERGIEAQTMCTKCGKTEERKIIDITKERCSKCRARVGYAYVCEDCKNILPFLPPSAGGAETRAEYLKRYEDAAKCPKCNSHNIRPLPTKDEIRELLTGEP